MRQKNCRSGDTQLLRMRGLLNPDVRPSAFILLLVCERGGQFAGQALALILAPGTDLSETWPLGRSVQSSLQKESSATYGTWKFSQLGRYTSALGAGGQKLKGSRERAGWVCLGTNCTPYLMISRVCFDDF